VESPKIPNVRLEYRHVGWRVDGGTGQGRLDFETPKMMIDASGRFDFDGSVAQGGLTDARDGLHNHAATPKAPGYTIIELCTMARSSFISQRVTALGIIEALLVKLARRELPDGLFSLLADAEA
jgi:hypothetical protein